MGRKHYRIRADIRARMRAWNRAGCVLWWVTFTTASGGDAERLRPDWQAWRKRLARDLDVDPVNVQYAMVDTSEGHGVLHLVMALPPGSPSWLPREKLAQWRGWWTEIHGATFSKFRPIGRGDTDVRKLSQYIVSQYMVLQGDSTDLLGRYSASRCVAPLGQWRRALMAVVASKERARAFIRAMSIGPALADFVVAWKAVRREQFTVFRAAWDDLLSRGWCSFYGERWCLVGDQLQEV